MISLRICGWCRRWLGIKRWCGSWVTHGICRRCTVQVLAEAQRAGTNWEGISGEGISGVQ